MLTRSMSLAAVLAALVLAAAGCGDDDSDDGGGGGGGSDDMQEAGGGAGGGSTDLKLSADPSGAPKFDKSSLSAQPGKVTIVMDNPSDVPHAVEVEGAGVEEEGKTVGKGGVSEVSAELQAGEYEYYCPVGNHQDQGMEGTLTVG